jgi:putative ABC transport system permease protein
MLPLLRLLIIPHKKLFILILALLIWVMGWFTFLSQSLFSLSAFLQNQTKETLGGDIVIEWVRPMNEQQITSVNELLCPEWCTKTKTVRFLNSLPIWTGQPLLTTVIWYDTFYPLYGTLETTNNAQWVLISSSLAQSLWNVSEILLWAALLPIDWQITSLPGAWVRTFDGWRTILVPFEQLPQTELIQTGSRVSYRTAYRLWAWNEEQRIRALESLLPEFEIDGLEETRSQQEQFFSQLKSVIVLALCSLVLLTFSGLRIMNDMLQRRLLETVRLVRLLWSTQKKLMRTGSAIMIWLIALAILLWWVLGYRAWFFVPRTEVGIVPEWSWIPFTRSSIVCLALCVALVLSRKDYFSSSNLLAAWVYTPIKQASSAIIIGLVLLFSLITELGISRSTLLLGGWILWLLAGVYGALYALVHALARATLSWKSSRLARRWVIRRSSQPWSPMVLMQTIMVTLLTISAICFLFWLSIRSFVTNFTAQEQPNTFLLNLRSSDIAPLQQLFPWTPSYDVILWRIITIDGVTLREVMESNNRVSWRYTREFNMTTVPLFDEVTEWFSSWQQPWSWEVSVDSRIAEELWIRVGMVVRMSIVGREFDLKVVQLRRTTRNAIKPFFFFQLSAEQFADAPRSYFSLQTFPLETRGETLKAITDRLGNHLSFIEVDDILEQVQRLLQAITWSIILVLSSVVWCGAVLLLLSFKTIRTEHIQDMRLITLLGVKPWFVDRSTRAASLYPWLLASALSVLLVVIVWIALRLGQDALPMSVRNVVIVLWSIVAVCGVGVGLVILGKK